MLRRADAQRGRTGRAAGARCRAHGLGLLSCAGCGTRPNPSGAEELNRLEAIEPPRREFAKHLVRVALTTGEATRGKSSGKLAGMKREIIMNFHHDLDFYSCCSAKGRIGEEDFLSGILRHRSQQSRKAGPEVPGEGDRHGQAQAKGPGGPHGRTCLAGPFTAHLPGLYKVRYQGELVCLGIRR